MKTILPLLFFGVIAGSCIVGAAGNNSIGVAGMSSRYAVMARNRAGLVIWLTR